ncbi:MAG: hypothetical protein ACNFW9_01810 [Candidatus Kerfeldbacteria bacterium]
MKQNYIKKSNKLVSFIKLIIWIVPVIIFAFIINSNFAPLGILDIEYNVNEDSNLVRNFANKEPDKLIGTINPATNNDYYQLITTTPVYFDVNVPRAFTKATVTMKYQNIDQQPEISLGVKQANKAYYYKDMAFFNESLENLSDHWNKIDDADATLWQKDVDYYNAKQSEIDILDELKEGEMLKLNNEFPDEFKSTLDKQNFDNKEDLILKEYKDKVKVAIDEVKDKKNNSLEYLSINDFFSNFPEPTKVLKFNYDLDSFLEIPGYEQSNKVLEINKSLRGSHEIYTYIGSGEDLNFIFTLQDSNRHNGEDVLNVKVYNSKNELIEEVSAPDDGEIHATGKILPERRHQLLIEDLSFGTYRLILNIPDDDIFIKKIETHQHLVMFKKNIYLTDNIEYKGIINEDNISPTTLYTNSSYVKARTSHDNGLQVLRVGSNNLRLEDKHILNEIKTLGGIVPIVSPKNDIYIEGDGFFAFTKEQLFDPNFSSVKNVDQVENINEFDFILSKYPKVEFESNWQIASASVEAPYLFINEGKDKIINFMIDLPGLPENDRQLKINQINIRFEKDPITFSRVLTKIRQFFSNIKAKF